MNRKRTEFLQRNRDPHLKIYLSRDHVPCDTFVIYDGGWTEKNKQITGKFISGSRNKEWTEDKIAIQTQEDVEFFLKWYQDFHQVKVTISYE